jgi:hypothetical protein
MMNSSLIVIGGQKTLHFGSGAGDGAPGSFGKGDGITFLVGVVFECIIREVLTARMCRIMNRKLSELGRVNNDVIHGVIHRAHGWFAKFGKRPGQPAH